MVRFDNAMRTAYFYDHARFGGSRRNTDICRVPTCFGGGEVLTAVRTFPSLRTAVVTDDERNRFHQNGFLVVDRPVINESARRQVRELLDALFGRAQQVPRLGP